MNKINIIRGFNDILPLNSYKWQFLESKIKFILDIYQYKEVKFPIVEKKELFHRSIGESSDIISKETYNFQDRNGNNITLRPEGTASCARMVIENNLINRGNTQKLWYYGPMFRYERPQKGRYRQFYQIGVEAYGFNNIGIDLEIITIIWRILKELKIYKYVILELNIIALGKNRNNYISKLLKYLKSNYNNLDKDSIKRLNTNPLRILDSKIEKTQKILLNAPKIIDFIDINFKLRFKQICQYLNSLGIKYKINHNLVRGLDYYTSLVFEWTSTKIGSQNSICSGGRYDNLIENLGGHKTSAIGFAIGIERLILLMENLNKIPKLENNFFHIFFILDNNYLHQSLVIVENIRQEFPNIQINTDLKFGSIKSQLKKAYKSNSKIIIIIGKKELDYKFITIKYLYKNIKEKKIYFNNLTNFFKNIKI